MAEFKTAFVAIIFLFCLLQNGCGQQYEDQNVQYQLNNWQPSRSRLRSKPARSVAPSLYEIPNNSSPDITTRNRQRTRGRNIPEPLADPRYDTFDIGGSQQEQLIQDLPPQVDFQRGNTRTGQQRTNIKTLEDSLNTERYQKRVERPQNFRRNGYVDQSDLPQSTEFPSLRRRNDNAGTESPARRLQRTRGRVAAERRSSSASGFDEVPQTQFADTTQPLPSPRGRATFRGRTTFQDVAAVTARSNDIPKRGRTRGFTSRYQNIDATEPTVGIINDNVRGVQPSVAEPQELSRTPLPNTVTQFQRDPNQFGQQFATPGQPGNEQFLQTQQIDVNQQRGRSDTIFPNLSTQQFSTDPAQFLRGRNDNLAPTAQQIPTEVSNQQFIQGNPQNQQFIQGDFQNQQFIQGPPLNQQFQTPNLQTGAEVQDAQQLPLSNQFTGQPRNEVIQPDQNQILRRIDSNEAERTPQFIPVETPKGRSNFRSRSRAPVVSSTQDPETSPEVNTQPSDSQSGRSRGRQGSFRSRNRQYISPSDEGVATSPPRSRAATRTQHERENVPLRNAPTRGRTRAQAVETRPSLEAKERSFTEELPQAETSYQSTQPPIKPLSRPAKPFRGTVTAKVVQSEEDIDTTANYPKEFLEKLKSSKGFVPPPKRVRTSIGTTGEQSFTPTAFNSGTARLKRKQYTTETYSHRDSDTSETNNRETHEEQTPLPEGTREQETSTARQRYSQRFYKKLAAKGREGNGVYSTSRPRSTTEPNKPNDTAPRSRIPVRRPFKSFSPTTTTTAKPTTTEFEITSTEASNSGEERRKFVPKKKLTLEERKQRIARLKEKLRQNATESELKTEESQESYVVKEALVPQANTHPGSREAYHPDEGKNTVEVKSSVSSNVKTGRGAVRFHPPEDTSNKYDLITQGSEESIEAIYVGKNLTTTTTQKPTTKPTTTTKKPTTKPNSTTKKPTTKPTTTKTTTTTHAPEQSGTRTPRTITTSAPQAATQVPLSTTTEPGYAVLNVTLFPSTRHRFSARINSTTNISLPPDVELITTTTPSTALNTPEIFPLLERKPDRTLSVYKLFNSSLSTTTSASVERGAAGGNSSSTALFNQSTLSPSTTTRKSSTTTTRRSSSKKKSSGRKKSKKSKSKTSGSRTTTKKPGAASAKSRNSTAATTTTSTTTVRTTSVSSARNTSNSNSTAVKPLSLAFDIESIINETMRVVNSNPMTGPLPGNVPRTELDALTPETIVNGTDSEDTTEGTTARVETTTLSNTNSTDNSTNQVETPGRLTSEVNCINGNCTNSKSQSVYFNEGSSNSAREPIPYARHKGTTKSPETLRKIFIYGIFPNNTVRKKPFPGQEEGFPAGQYTAGRRPATSIPPYTAGDYDVFGVYPNNSVVRRRGWKTFDYEKYHSPYVIFGIYPNNTIVKKYPNGTTINDEFMVSDNEIRRTFSDGKVYKGCTCANGVHFHGSPPPTLTTESTTSTTTSTTETSRKPSDTETENPSSPEAGESETEEPERNAKDDAESFDVSGSISETERPEISTTELSESTTTTESSETSEAEENAGEEEEEEDEEEEEETTETTTEESTTTSPSSDITENTTETSQDGLAAAEEADVASTPESVTETSEGSLAEAEEADIASTPETQTESTTAATESEGLEQAEEVDDASTPKSFEQATSSLEREETQNAGDSGGLAEAEDADTKRTTTESPSDGLSDAEEADAGLKEGTEPSLSDRTTERSENIEESTTESSDFGYSTTETSEYIEARTTRSDTTTEITTDRSESTTERSQNIEEITTERREVGYSTTETSENTEESTTTRNDFGYATTERSENIEEVTTERSDSEGGSTTERNENIEEKTTAKYDFGYSTTGRNEDIEEATTQRQEGTTEGSESIEGRTAGNDLGYGTTERSESTDERTTARTDVGYGTTERSESIEERTTVSPDLGSGTTEGRETTEERTTARTDLGYGTTERSESIEERTAGNDLEYGTTDRSENIEEGTTARSDFAYGTTERNENIEGRTTARYDAGDATTQRSENIQEVTTARYDIGYSTTEGSESEGEEKSEGYSELRTTERTENIDDRTEEYYGSKTTERTENVEETERNLYEERRTEENEITAERTTARPDAEILPDRGDENESIQQSTTENSENLEERTTEGKSDEGYNLFDRTTQRTESFTTATESERTVESTTQQREDLEERTAGEINFPQESTTEKSFNYEERTTEENEIVGERTTQRSENLEDRATEENDIYGYGNDNLKDKTTEETENYRDRTTEISYLVESATTKPETAPESTTSKTEYYENAGIIGTESPAGRPAEGTTPPGVESDSEKNYLLGTEVEDSAKTTLFPYGITIVGYEGTKTPKTTDNTVLDDLADTTGATKKTSAEGHLIIDLNSEVESPKSTTEDTQSKTTVEESTGVDLTDEDIRELNELKKISSGKEVESTTVSTTQSSDENTVPTSQDRGEEGLKATTESTGSTDSKFEGYVYEKPTKNSFDFEDNFAFLADHLGKNLTQVTTPPSTTAETTLFAEDVTQPVDSAETSTTDYDIDVRRLGDLISRLTTGMFGESATDPSNFASLLSTTEGPDAKATSDNDLLNALLPLSIEYIQGSASGNQVIKRHRRAVNDLDEPSSLTNLAYRALSSADSTPIPILTTTTTKATKPATAAPARGKTKKLKNLSKTTVTAYKNLTNLTSTPPPDEVFIVTPVATTRGNPDTDYYRRGKVKFVTLTPGVVVTTNIHDNDILTMSSQHVQKVTKAPAKIPDNFLSTVFGEIEEKASSPIPDILKNVENDIQGDGLSASLARRIITLALEKAMTSTTPAVTPQSITATTVPPPSNIVFTTPVPQPTASYIQRITAPQPESTTATTTTTTTTKKPKTTTTTKKPTTTTTTTKKPKPTTTSTTTTTTTTTTTRKPITSTTRRPRTTTTTTTTEATNAVLITPKKTGNQQGGKRKPSAAITSPEFLGSTTGPEISDSQPAVEVVPLGLDQLTVLFSDEKSSVSTTTTTPSSQKVTEDLNVLLSGLWQEQTSAAPKLPDASSNLVESKKKSTKSKSNLSKQASASLSENDLKILEAILQQQGANGAAQDLEQIVQNQIRLAEEVRKASRNLKKKQRTTTTTTTERTPLGLGFLLNLFGAGSRPNGLFSNEQRNTRRQRPVLAQLATLNGNNGSATPDPFNELDEGITTGERSARGELVSAAIDVTKAVSKFMGTVLTSAAQSFQNFFRNLGR